MGQPDWRTRRTLCRNALQVQRSRILSDSSVRRFALTRDPLERAISSYYSKVACGTGDTADHAGVIRQLMKQSPKAVAAGFSVGTISIVLSHASTHETLQGWC